MFSTIIISQKQCFQHLLYTENSVFGCYYILVYTYCLLSGFPLYYEALFPTFPNKIMSNRKLTICRLQTITQEKPPPRTWEMENDTKKETLANFMNEKN